MLVMEEISTFYNLTHTIGDSWCEGLGKLRLYFFLFLWLLRINLGLCTKSTSTVWLAYGSFLRALAMLLI